MRWRDQFSKFENKNTKVEIASENNNDSNQTESAFGLKLDNVDFSKFNRPSEGVNKRFVKNQY